ncbi:MAG: hypothetical protein P8M80_14850 [Pirellulaceae bacterium]|nr:hypothetical protein [Pirellulaceae bacterium]
MHRSLIVSGCSQEAKSLGNCDSSTVVAASTAKDYVTSIASIRGESTPSSTSRAIRIVQPPDQSSDLSSPQPNGIKVTSFEELVNVFKTRNIAIESNSKNQVIQINASQDDSRSVLVIKWDNKNGVIHFIQVMPMILKEEQEALFLQSAAILNHGFLFPGIGINPVNHGTYYRLSLPISPRGYLWDFEVIPHTRLSNLINFIHMKQKPITTWYHQSASVNLSRLASSLLRKSTY